MNNPAERADKRPPRVWSTISVGETPDVLADDAVKQARLWEAVGRDKDSRFRVSFGDTYSDADMSVVGREEDLLPLLADLAHRGFRYHLDTQTAEDADRLDALYGESEPVDHVFAYVEHDG